MQILFTLLSAVRRIKIFKIETCEFDFEIDASLIISFTKQYFVNFYSFHGPIMRGQLIEGDYWGLDRLQN